MLSELSNTNWIANINAAITANASAIENYDISNYPTSTVLSSAQGYVPVITQAALETSINAWQSSQAAGMISNGVAPSIQQLVSCLQALENEAGSGTVNFMSPRGHHGAHLQTADYTGGAHLLRVNKYAPFAAIAGGICGLAAAIIAPEVILVIGAYELTTTALLGGMAGLFGIVSGIDEANDW